MASFASEIRAEMGRQSVGVTELAERSGISRQQINLKIQREERVLNSDEMSALSTALGIPAWELLRRATETTEVTA